MNDYSTYEMLAFTVYILNFIDAKLSVILYQI